MRSFDRSMPEELNRVLTDHLSDLLLCASETAAENLRAESAHGQIEVVGDVMVDVACSWRPTSPPSSETLAAYDIEPGGYLLLTAHRAGNVDEPERLRAFVDLVAALPGRVLFPVHPRTRGRLRETGLLGGARGLDGLLLTEPLGYVEFGALRARRARGAHRLGGRPEGGLPGGGSLCHAAGQHRVGGDGRCRWNTLVDLDGGARWRRWNDASPDVRRCTATANASRALRGGDRRDGRRRRGLLTTAEAPG